MWLNGGKETELKSIMKIPITKPFFDKNEYDLITKPLDSGWVVQGPFVREFEKKIAAFTGAEYAIAVSSCTSGHRRFRDASSWG